MSAAVSVRVVCSLMICMLPYATGLAPAHALAKPKGAPVA